MSGLAAAYIYTHMHVIMFLFLYNQDSNEFDSAVGSWDKEVVMQYNYLSENSLSDPCNNNSKGKT